MARVLDEGAKPPTPLLDAHVKGDRFTEPRTQIHPGVRKALAGRYLQQSRVLQNSQ